MSSLALASDPHTSIRDLLHLAADHPAEVANNPALRRQNRALQQVDLLAGLALASCERSPAWLLEYFGAHGRPELRAAVAQNGACPAPLLSRLSFDAEPEVRQTAWQNPAAPAELRALGAAVASSELSPRSLALLAMGPVRAAQAADCPVELLRVLGRLGHDAMFSVLRNPGCPQDLADELLRAWLDSHKTGVIDLSIVASLPRISEATLGLLLAHPACASAIPYLVHNPSLKPEQARFLLGQMLPAGRKHSSLWIDLHVVVRLLERFEIDRELLLRLLGASVARSYGASVEIVWQKILDRVTDLPACSATVLGKMAAHREQVVRIEAARHRRTPVGVLLRLLGDRCYQVRRAAWANRKLPASWRARLLKLGFAPGLPTLPATCPPMPEELTALREAGPWFWRWAGLC